MLKRFLKSDGLRNALCWIAAQYIRLVFWTGRWTVEGGEEPGRRAAEGKPFILAFWHGRILMMPCTWRWGTTIHMLISMHRDGQIIARTVSHFGIQTVAGSTSKGGSAALRSMLKALKSGDCVGITPDGPRGPRMRASEGVLQVARLSGVSVLPATFSARRRKVINSWDRFIVPLPFTRGVFVWGQPIDVPAKLEPEEQAALLQKIEDELNAITARADRLMGHEPILPAAHDDVRRKNKA